MSGLGVPTLEEVLGERSMRDDESLTREYNLLRSVLVTIRESSWYIVHFSKITY